MYQVTVILLLVFAFGNVFCQWRGSLLGSSMFSANNGRNNKVNSFGNENLYNFNQNLNWNSANNEQSNTLDQNLYLNNENQYLGGTSNFKQNAAFSSNAKSESRNPFAENNNRFSMSSNTIKNNKQGNKANSQESIQSGGTKNNFKTQTWQNEKVKKTSSAINSPFSSTSNTNSNSAQSVYNNDAKYFAKSENNKKSSSINQNSNSFFTPSNDIIIENSNDDYNKWNPNKKKIASNNNSNWPEQELDNENVINQNWQTNKKDKTNFSKKPESQNWKTSSKPFENENNQNSKKENSNSNKQNGSSSSMKDLSILDELDKNDWYFGSEENFPEIDKYSNINIDVRELWDFDKRKGVGGSRRRKYRQAEMSCECVDINLCDEEDMILTKEDMEKNNWRFTELPECERLTEVCCTHPQSEYTTRYKNSFEKKPYLLECGQRAIAESLLEKIEDNNYVVDGELPWSLILENSRDGSNCGASLVHPKFALTAAHCVTGLKPEDLKVTAGLWNSNDDSFQQREVSKIIIHSGFSEENPRNDIALLLVDQPFVLTNNVNTICLPVTNDRWFSNRCFVAGQNLRGDTTKMLQKGLVNFIPQSECQNILLSTESWNEYILHNSFVCAVESKPKSFCLGDEGSAVICPSKKFVNTYLQIGIVSKSLNCNELGQPGIFTNTLKFLDWINKYIFEMEAPDTAYA